MNQLQTIVNGKHATMSSREIADVVESRHDDVKRSIERLVSKGVIVQPPLADEQSMDELGRPRITQVYLMDKRSSLIVVAQLCPEFTARIVDRWQAKVMVNKKPNHVGYFDCPHQAHEAYLVAKRRLQPGCTI